MRRPGPRLGQDKDCLASDKKVGAYTRRANTSLATEAERADQTILENKQIGRLKGPRPNSASALVTPPEVTCGSTK